MLQFERHYHEAVKDGIISLAFRHWDTLKVLRGKIYRSHNLGLLRVVDVDFRKLRYVTIEEVNRSGYDTMDDFLHSLTETSDLDIDYEKDRVVRIEFEYIGEDIENYKKSMGNVKDSEIFNIKEQLLVLEQNNDTPWVRRTLQLLRDNEYLSTVELEELLNISEDRIREFMKRLKTLHLISYNDLKGCSITPLGIKLLRHFYGWPLDA